MLHLTDEQQAIIDTLKQPTTKLVSVNAVSGAGKTALLVAATKALKPESSLYLAYNNAIAYEAQRKFPKTVCKTTHSLAFANTVKTQGFKVGQFTYREIKEKVPYEIKLETTVLIRKFCLSAETSLKDFIENQHSASTIVEQLADKYIKLMESGKIDCTHEFYLKYYHLLLHSKAIEHETFDLLMLDEAGDLNPVTLAIFKLLPAKKKIMVGDENQNIYSFNDTINGFKIMKDEAINMQMTKSFRVSHDIAARVEAFARVHMSPNFIFKGVDYGESKDTIESQAFISRTNSALISEMIRLNDLEVSYNLTRPVDQIFKLPLTLMSLKPGKYVSPEFKHLKEDMDYYYKHIQDLRLEYASLNSFLLARHPDDVNLKSAVSLISKYGSKDIWAAYNHAKSHEHKNSYLTLCTAHSSKGLEFDHVEIADDLNSVIDRYKDISCDQRDNHQQEEFRLYYVAVTRAKKSLTNDKHLYFQEVA